MKSVGPFYYGDHVFSLRPDGTWWALYVDQEFFGFFPTVTVAHAAGERLIDLWQATR